MARILIVEDEFQVLVLAESILQDAGYETLSASNKEQALAVFDAGEEIDLLFTDIQLLDDLNGGLEVAREAFQSRPELRVLYTTGAQITDGMQAMFVEGSEVLPKPYVPPDLLAAIERLLKARG
jgi:CheY-like chemotaxis protein